MSLDYSIELDTQLTPEQLQHILESLPVASAAGLWRSRAVPISPRSQEVWQETYGFRPTVGFSYELTKNFEDRGRQERDVLASVAALWSLVPGDSYVTYLDGIPVLKRVGQRVVASTEWIRGQERRRSILDDVIRDSYEIAALPDV